MTSKLQRGTVGVKKTLGGNSSWWSKEVQKEEAERDRRGKPR